MTAQDEHQEAIYKQARELVMRDRKPSTSYVQRKLQLNYNTASALMDRMEREGIVGPRNHAGMREILPPTEGPTR